MKNRNASLDAFRCLLMFLIVLYHAAVFGLWGGDGAPKFLGLVFGALIIWHVDGFIALSGWFGVKFSLLRFFKIWGTLLFYGVLSWAYLVFVQHQPICSSFKITGGWYGGLYLTLLFLSPLLNAGLESIAKMPLRHQFLIAATLVFGVTLNALPKHLYSGIDGGGGCSLLTFLYLYALTRMLKLSGIAEKIGKKMIGGIGCIYLVALFVLSVVPALYLYSRNGQANLSLGVWTLFMNYQAPVVVMMSLGVLVFFDRFVVLPKFVARLTSLIAPSMFGVYLGHTSCVSYGRRLFQVPQEWLQSNMSFSPYLSIVLSTIVCFVICILIDMFRRCVFARLNVTLGCMIKNIDEKIGLV